MMMAGMTQPVSREHEARAPSAPSALGPRYGPPSLQPH